jgi:hypothetical protein
VNTAASGRAYTAQKGKSWYRRLAVAFVRELDELVAEHGKRNYWLFHGGKRPEERM